MVGIVIVSHSKLLAEGVVDVTRIMADGCPIVAAGGTDDGGYGTSFTKIRQAIDQVHDTDGVLILADMGSAVMTAEMAIEDAGYPDVELIDCPIAEGAIAASLSAVCGDDRQTVKEQALSSKTEAKW